MRNPLTGKIETIIGSIRVLVIEDNPYLRKLVRNLLVNVGVKKIEEVEDALSGFESIKTVEPDIVMLEWDMPLLNGAELVRIIRAPGMLARAEVPIIMFSASAPRGRRRGQKARGRRLSDHADLRQGPA